MKWMLAQSRRYLAGGLFFAHLLVASHSQAQWTGEAGVEIRYFLNDALFPEQFDGLNSSAYFLPEYYRSWNQRRDSIVIEPFLRLDQNDPERSHADLRELHWRHASDQWELKLGISTVFWGVTESQHLVDVINQTDAVENLDGEDKLGQPMAMLRVVRNWGTLDAYLLPGFRERQFPGPKGRLSGLAIDSDNPRYESGAKDLHTDVAFRWSQIFGDFDLGLSYFRGTARTPRFDIPLLADSNTSLQLRPVYEQINQFGLDLQATLGAWLWKLEAIHRSGQGDDYVATTFGFEYSMYSVFGSDADIGVLIEYLYDERDANTVNTLVLDQPLAQVGPDNDVFIGGRFGFNDMQGSELLAGCSLDMDSSARFCIIEGSRRLTDQWVASLEARFFSAVDEDHPFATVRNDDLIQLDLTFHF